jgi:single-stranded-DNA-specific exonuclease
MADKLQEVSSLLTKFGGHPLAAGFSLPRANIEEFRLQLNQKNGLTKEQLNEKIWIDVPMPCDYVSEKLVHDFEKLEPFGQGNEKPKFAEKGLFIADLRILGKNRNCVKFTLRSRSGSFINAILFADGDRFLTERGNQSVMDIIYYPVINEYNGNRTLQMVISDYQLHEA